jgi:hypothetical protein
VARVDVSGRRRTPPSTYPGGRLTTHAPWPRLSDPVSGSGAWGTRKKKESRFGAFRVPLFISFQFKLHRDEYTRPRDTTTPPPSLYTLQQKKISSPRISGLALQKKKMAHGRMGSHGVRVPHASPLPLPAVRLPSNTRFPIPGSCLCTSVLRSVYSAAPTSSPLPPHTSR